ncbi:MAG: hypothetical protein ACREBS_11020 [Nitrososphaerales archaeon]
MNAAIAAVNIAKSNDTTANNLDERGDIRAIALVLKCEHCGKQFIYEFKTPIAAKCIHCDSVFDGRLQIFKDARVDYERITSL